MNSKCTQLPPKPHYIEAGIDLNDTNIEFVGNRHNKTIVWMQNGRTHRFNELPGRVFKSLLSLYKSDKNAQMLIKMEHPEAASISKQVHLYTYYMYGGFDKFPDVVDGTVQTSENFTDKANCISLEFTNKVIAINGQPLKNRYIKMLYSFASGDLDSNIAETLGIAMPTYDFHKSKLFKILNVNSKPEAVAVAFKNHVLCVR